LVELRKRLYDLSSKNKSLVHLRASSKLDADLKLFDFANGKSILVRVRRLDSIWEDAGRPQIAFLKIDVEGGEVAVIHGACRLIESCLPTILIEANSTAKLDRLCILLTSYGYQVMQPNGFNSHNYIFFHPIREQDRSAI